MQTALLLAWKTTGKNASLLKKKKKKKKRKKKKKGRAKSKATPIGMRVASPLVQAEPRRRRVPRWFGSGSPAGGDSTLGPSGGFQHVLGVSRRPRQ